MAVVIPTVDDIATALGRDDTPSGSSAEARQWEMWIGDAELLIRARLGDLSLLDQDALGYVIREAVVAQVRNPDDATSVEVAVDDARGVRRYSTSSGRVYIRDEWWRLLDPAGASKSAYGVDTLGGSVGLVHADTCALRFGAVYCSCGAILTGAFALYGTDPW